MVRARGKLFQLRERRLGEDLHGAGSRRVRAPDVAAVPGEFARDVAHLLFRRDDVDVDDRLEHDRPRLAQRIEERLAPGGDKRHFL